MALRLQSYNIKDLADVATVIEIHDSDYVAGTVNFWADNVKIKFAGNASKTYQPITASTLSFEFLVENATHETFITDLVGSPENEFSIKVERGGSLYWAGQIVIDKAAKNDQYYPYTFQINAVCGLSVLKDVEYWNDGTAYAGSSTHLEHIQNILGKTLTQEHWGVTDDYLITGINWFEDHHASPNDPLTVTRVSHEAFYKIRDDGQKDYKSCYEVLTELLTSFEANIRLSSGAWYVNQLTEYANSTQRRVSYYKSGLEKVASASTSYDIEIDQTRTDAAGTGRWRTGGTYTNSPPLREVRLTYNNDIPANLIVNYEWDNATGSDEISAGQVSDGNGQVTLRFTGTLNVTVDATVSSYIAFVHKFKFLIKVGSYYLKREAFFEVGDSTYVYGAFWTTDFAYFEYYTPIIVPTSTPDTITGGLLIYANENFTIDFTTPPLEASGDVTVDFFRDITLHQTTGIELDFTALSMTYHLFGTSLEPQGIGGGASLSQSLTYTCPNPDTDYNTKKDEYKVSIGDGPTDAYPGHIEVYDGATWESSADWRLADAGTAYALGDLFVREMMALQRQSREIYNGSIIGQAAPTNVTPPAPHNRVEINPGEFYFLLTGTIDLTEWRLNGTWLLVDKDITSVTPDNTVSSTADQPVIGAPGTGGSGPPVTNPGGIGIFSNVSTANLSSGFVSGGFNTVIPVADSGILPGQINEGDSVTITNPGNGVSETFEVVADHPGGSAGIAVYADVNQNYPSGSFVQVFQVQTVSGSEVPEDTISDVFQEATSEITDSEYLGISEMEFRWPEDAGNGSTAGIIINSEGVRVFDSSSSTPIGWLRTDDELPNFKALVFQQIISEITKEAGLFYIYKDAYPVLADLVATRPLEPVSKMFQMVAYNTNVTVTTLNDFFPIGTKWSGYRFGRYKITCQSYGSGAGNNQLKIYKNGVLQITAGFTIPLWTNIGVPISMTLTDYFHFEVSSVRATPPKGLVVEMEFII